MYITEYWITFKRNFFIVSLTKFSIPNDLFQITVKFTKFVHKHEFLLSVEKNYLIGRAQVLLQFYIWGNWEFVMSSSLKKTTQLEGSRAQTWTQLSVFWANKFLITSTLHFLCNQKSALSPLPGHKGKKLLIGSSTELLLGKQYFVDLLSISTSWLKCFIKCASPWEA